MARAAGDRFLHKDQKSPTDLDTRRHFIIFSPQSVGAHRHPSSAEKKNVVLSARIGSLTAKMKGVSQVWGENASACGAAGGMHQCYVNWRALRLRPPHLTGHIRSAPARPRIASHQRERNGDRSHRHRELIIRVEVAEEPDGENAREEHAQTSLTEKNERDVGNGNRGGLMAAVSGGAAWIGLENAIFCQQTPATNADEMILSFAHAASLQIQSLPGDGPANGGNV